MITCQSFVSVNLSNLNSCREYLKPRGLALLSIGHRKSRAPIPSVCKRCLPLHDPISACTVAKKHISSSSGSNICLSKSIFARGIFRCNVALQRCNGVALASSAGHSAHEILFILSTLYSISVFILIAVAPFSRGVVRYLRHDAVIMPIALAYSLLLLRSWQPDTLSLIMPGSLAEGISAGSMNVQFVPKLAGIVQLFSRAPTAASLWLHLLSINLFSARWIMFDGLRQRILTLHSVLVASVFGPLGLCCHFVTQLLARWAKSVVIRRPLSSTPA